MTDYTFAVAMDVRAFGSVDVEAPTLKKALSKVTHDYLCQHFESNGGGADDFDMTPLDASISQANWMPKTDSESSYEEEDLDHNVPNPHFRFGYLTLAQALVMLNAMRLLYLAQPTDVLMATIADLEQQFKHIKGEVPA